MNKKDLKVGALVRCSHWIYEGKIGLIVAVQSAEYCRGAYVLLRCGALKLIRIENLEIVNESG